MANLNAAGAGARATDLTTFTIKVDGAKLPGTYSVIGVDISREINRIPRAQLVLYDGDAARQNFDVSSGDLLIPGKTIEIDGGYAMKENLLFKGVITGQRISVKQRGDSLLHIDALDASFRLTLDRKSGYFTDLTDSDLFEEVIRRHPDLRPQVASTSATYREIVQYQVSDWDLIVTRAEKAGMYCLADNGMLRIEKPDLQQKPVVTLTYGDNIFDLDLELDSRSQYQKITVSAWDHANQEVTTSDIDDVSSPSQGNIDGATLAGVGAVENYELRHSGRLEQQEIDAWAEAGMIKSRFSRIRGTVRLQGTEVVKPGVLVQLAGLGERFNGTAFVSGVRHILGEGDWETTIQLGLHPNWHHERFEVNAPPAAGFHPTINGLHVGVVTQLQNDPEGEDRILVRVPLINADDSGVWSRLATLDAGENRGTVFRPEINDEVIVGFINDDPNEPVVLGMLHSSSKPAPISGSDDNHEKGLVTRSGMKIHFNDETPSTTIETPNGNKIVIDDSEGHIQLTDQTGNTVTMSSDGISMESLGDILLKATGDVKIEGTNTSIKANASASLTATADVKIEGSSGATMKSGGVTEVKGSSVMIN
ncbi:MAG TPA: type VI secretion system tip protein VgrG [Candidatus Deferrimicrobium sp.]|nr:type VI secretion system tip protein VgrG [Candidatus Deferrimicrobium sp.]